MKKFAFTNALKSTAVAVFAAGVLVVVATVGTGPAALAVSPTGSSPVLLTTFATTAVTAACQPQPFFGLVPWYNYLDKEINTGGGSSRCDVTCFNVLPRATPNDCTVSKSDIPAVLLAIVDNMLRIAGLVAVAFVLVGAFQFVASRGNSERTAGAQSTVINALVGLTVALLAIGFISYVGGKLQ